MRAVYGESAVALKACTFARVKAHARRRQVFWECAPVGCYVSRRPIVRTAECTLKRSIRRMILVGGVDHGGAQVARSRTDGRRAREGRRSQDAGSNHSDSAAHESLSVSSHCHRRTRSPLTQRLLRPIHTRMHNREHVVDGTEYMLDRGFESIKQPGARNSQMGSVS